MKTIHGMMSRARLSVAACLLLASFGASAEAPAGRYSIDTDTVGDRRTYLTWQRVAPATTYSHANANTYCAGLTLAGWSNWRLPNVKELQSLLDFENYSPAFDPTAFSGSPNGIYWSSTAWATNPTVSAWYVDFTLGSTFYGSTTGVPRYVRCVRTGLIIPG